MLRGSTRSCRRFFQKLLLASRDLEEKTVARKDAKRLRLELNDLEAQKEEASKACATKGEGAGREKGSCIT